MNKTRYKIATLTGSAVMAAMLLSLLILNIVFNKKIELRAENAIKNVFTLDSDEYLNYESENDTGSLYYASLVYMGADSENRDDIYQILTPKEKKLIDWYETHPSDEMQRAKINEATYYMKARTEYYEDGNERLLAYRRTRTRKRNQFWCFAGCFCHCRSRCCHWIFSREKT